MVRHIVLWNFVEGLSDTDKKEAGQKMKELLEPIKELVPGAVKIEVLQNAQPTSNREVALVSYFDTLCALLTYHNNTDHLVAGKYVRIVTCDRACMDYEY